MTNRPQSKFRDVTRENPCPVCRHADWCRVSEDGGLVCCRREKSHPTFGAGAFKTDKSGGMFWLYNSNPRPTESTTPTRHHSEGATNPTTADERHVVYAALLRAMPKTASVGKELDRRGVPKDSPLRKRCQWMPLTGRARIAHQLIAAGLEPLMSRTPGFHIAKGEKGDYWTFSGSPGLLIPVTDERARIVAILIRPENPKEGGPKYCWFTSKKRGGAGVSPPPVATPHGFKGDTSTVRVTEGALKAYIATELGGVLTLGMPGLYGKALVKALKAVGAKTVRLALDADLIRNSHVAIALASLNERLTKAGFTTELEHWNEADGKGLDDLLKNGKRPELITGEAVGKWIADAIGGAAEEATVSDPSPPSRIIIDTNEAEVVRQVITTLARCDDRLYLKDGQLAEVVVNAKGRARAVPLSAANIRTRITDCCRLHAQRGKGLVPAHPPDWLAPAVRDYNRFPGVRPLIGITTSPVLRSDGSVHQSPGYDPDTRILYVADGEFAPIPDNPTIVDAKAAAALLLAGVSQFPWETDADQAVWLAEVLTLTVRHAIHGPCPLFCHTANVAASGKTQLAKAAFIIATGRDLPMRGYPLSGRGRDRGENEEELGKIATTCAIEGHVAYMLDNATTGRGFGCSQLDAMVTTTTESGRKLGTNEAPERDFFTVFIVTGNNIFPIGDTVRRTIRLGLSSRAERPEEVEYRGPEVTDWARQERGKLFTAALTIASAYILAGKPDQRLKPLGSFEAWSALVRSALVWIGMPDPCQSKAVFVAEDEDRERVAALIELVELVGPGGQAVSAADIVKRVKDDLKATKPADTDAKAWTLTSVDTGHPAIDLFRTICPGTSLPDSQKLGLVFRKYKGRTIGNKRLEKGDGDTHKNVALWRVARVGGNDAGMGETDSRQEGGSFPQTDPTSHTIERPSDVPEKLAGMEDGSAGMENGHSRVIPASTSDDTAGSSDEAAGMREYMQPFSRVCTTPPDVDSPVPVMNGCNHSRIPATDPLTWLNQTLCAGPVSVPAILAAGRPLGFTPDILGEAGVRAGVQEYDGPGGVTWWRLNGKAP